MRLFIVLFLLTSSTAWSQPVAWQSISTHTQASFRSLSVVSDSVAWAGGNSGTVGRSTDGGVTWQFNQVPGFDKVDFRSLYAFDKQKALIANAGSPAYILLTLDGGQSWKVVYTNEHADAFFDGMDFWDDKEGVIYGDPIRGRMLMLRTRDGGLTWQEVEQTPVLNEGEASFAASNTGIRCMGKSTLWVATGGKVSRLLVSNDKGNTWRFINTPIIQGMSSTGIFSLAFKNKKEGVIVGGDYQRDTLRTNHVFYTMNGGKNWKAPVISTRGYRECVEYLDEKLLLAAGPKGVDVSYDGGITWQALSGASGLSVVRKARNGKRVMGAGSRGRIAVLR